MAGKSAARDALLEEIKRQTERIQTKSGAVNRASEAAMVRNLALAFRYVEGGPQPGAAAEQ